MCPKCYCTYCTCNAIEKVTPRTQKARGVKVIKDRSMQLTASFQTVPYFLIQSAEEVERAYQGYMATHSTPSTLFARPCPLTPRPGFVDSRPVHNLAELKKVWEETEKADPKGEILLTSPIQCNYSAVLAPGIWALGPGHDGATAGKGARSVPLLNAVPPEIKTILSSCHIPEDADPHMEVVYESNFSQPVPVQLRAGPKFAGLDDFIPSATKCVAVVKPMEDLLAWEAAVKEMPKGTVVWAPGGTLASHAALHCIGREIPFITTFEPKVGDILEPPSEVPTWDLGAVRDGLGYSALISIPESERRQYCHLILYGLHQAAALTGESSFWIGLAAGLMMRFGTAAAIGEWRHRPNQTMPEAFKLKDQIAKSAMGSRDQIYSRVLTGRPWVCKGKVMAKFAQKAMPNRSWLFERKKLADICEGYFCRNWGGAFGGAKWGQCTFSLFALEDAIKAVIQGADTLKGVEAKQAIMALITALNTAVNQAHNGGFWLGKFELSPSHATSASRGGWAGFIFAGPTIYKILKQWDNAKTRTAARRRAKAWGNSTIKRPAFKMINIKRRGLGGLTYEWAGIPIQHEHSVVGMPPTGDITVRRDNTDPFRPVWKFYCDGVPLNSCGVSINLRRPKGAKSPLKLAAEYEHDETYKDEEE